MHEKTREAVEREIEAVTRYIGECKTRLNNLNREVNKFEHNLAELTERRDAMVKDLEEDSIRASMIKDAG